MVEVLSLESAVDSVLKKKFNFKESIDLSLRLVSGISARGYCDLPHRLTAVKILVFDNSFKGDNKDSNITFGGEDLVSKISAKKSLLKSYNYSLATPEMMPKIGKIAKILGPRGLMPDAKLNMVAPDLNPLIKKISCGRIFFKSNRTEAINTSIGNSDLEKSHILENLSCFLDAVRDLKLKGNSLSDCVQTMSLSSTMGKGFFVKV